MSRLFISHSSNDNFEAVAFHDWLVSEGWSPDDIFLDLHDLGAGVRWKEALAKANERCEAVVLLASPDSLSSTECRLEIRMAQDYGKQIIVAILYLLHPDSLELVDYKQQQIVDLSVEPRDAVQTVTLHGEARSVTFSSRTLKSIKASLDQLGISPNSFTWRPADPATASPYPGFEGFARNEAALFFGRAGDIARGLAEVRRLRRLGVGQVMVIQAASGAGKSSFLKAGLWPRLERDGEVVPLAILRSAGGILTGETGLGRQLAAFLATHKRPITAGEIHQALAGDLDRAADALISLLNEASAMGHAVASVARPDMAPPTPIIAIDQAEELFAPADAEESQRFLALLARVLDPTRTETRPEAPRLAAAPLFLLTIRADNLDALMHTTEATGLKPPQPFLLPPIPREAYREIIEAPIAVANRAGMKLAIDPLLTQALVEASTGADALPLLAFTLRELLAVSRSGSQAQMTLDRYTAAGGMEGVLKKRLTAAQRAANAPGADLRRLIIPHLATWDEEARPPAAKRMVAAEARLFAGNRAGLRPLADALVQARLLTRAGGGPSETTLEVAHEALLRLPPLSDWLAEDCEFLAWRDRLAKSRAGYEANARGLLVGRELQIAKGWLEVRAEPDDIADEDRGFITESAAEDERLRDEAEAREHQRQDAELAAAKAREEAAREREATAAAEANAAKARAEAATQAVLAAKVREEAAAAETRAAKAREDTATAEARAAQERERAAADMATASRRVARRTMVGLVTASALAVAALGAGGTAYLQWQQAEKAKAIATSAQAEAQMALDDVADILTEDRTRDVPGFDLIARDLYGVLQSAYSNLATSPVDKAGSPMGVQFGALKARARKALIAEKVGAVDTTLAEFKSILDDCEQLLRNIAANTSDEEAVGSLLYTVANRHVSLLDALGRQEESLQLIEWVAARLDPRAKRSFGAEFHSNRGRFLNSVARVNRGSKIAVANPNTAALPPPGQPPNFEIMRPEVLAQRGSSVAEPVTTGENLPKAISPKDLLPDDESRFSLWIRSPLAVGYSIEKDARRSLELAPKSATARETLGIALINRRLDLDRAGRGDEGRKSLESGCEIVKEMHEEAPRSLRSAEFWGFCLTELAKVQTREGLLEQRLPAEALIDQAINVLRRNLLVEPDHTSSAASLFAALAQQAVILNKYEFDSPRVGNLKLTALQQLRHVFQMEPSIVSEAAGLSNSYSDIASYQVADKEEHYRVLAQLQAAAAEKAKTHPEVKFFSFLAADTAYRISEAVGKTMPNETRKALEVSLPFIGQSKVLQRNDEPDENQANLCSIYARLQKFVADDVERVKDLAEQQWQACAPLLDRFPWDFYLRSHLIGGRWQAGLELFRAGRIEEAKSHLEYASHWGTKDATEALAEIYEKGISVPADSAREKELRDLASRQSVKRFVVPTEFAGKKHPFPVYVMEWPKEFPYKGIEDQVLWVENYRGGKVPQDARDAFIKLHDIARDNNVSFPALVEYVLGSVQIDIAKLTKDAENGDASAMRRLGQAFEKGEGIQKDYAKAREWYERAAALGDLDAMRFLGSLYKNGQGVSQDYLKALEWMQKRLTVVERSETSTEGKPGARTASALGNVSWIAIFARAPDTTLAAAERALSLTPQELWIETNRAHAFMYLGRADEARTVYLAHKDKPVPNNDNKPWQQVIGEDFAAFRKAGLEHPQMAEVEQALGIASAPATEVTKEKP